MKLHPVSRRGAYRSGKLWNWALLIFGYGAGQGALFLSQTWLVIEQKLVLLAAFGTAFSFAILGIIIVDIGSQVALAQKTAIIGDTKDIQAHSENYVFVTVCRLIVAIPVAFLFLTYSNGIEDNFYLYYFLFGAPSFVFWAFNASGIIDGLRMSGFSGLTASLPYLTSAVAVVFVGDMAEPLAATILGSALSAGYLSSVGLHFVGLRWRGYTLSYKTPNLHQVLATLVEGLGVLMTSLPAQVYPRVQIALCNAFLGPLATASLIYARQVLTAATMLPNMYRRVEFPDMARSIRASNTSGLRIAFSAQRLANVAALFTSGLMLIVPFVISAFNSDSTPDAISLVSWFSAILLVSILSTTSTQGLLARAQYGYSAFIVIMSVLVNLILSFVLIECYGIVSFIVADIALHIIMFAGGAVVLRRRTKEQPPRPSQ